MTCNCHNCVTINGNYDCDTFQDHTLGSVKTLQTISSIPSAQIVSVAGTKGLTLPNPPPCFSYATVSNKFFVVLY